MEMLLFYSYLKYQKDTQGGMIKNILKLPAFIKIILIVLTIILILSLVFLFIFPNIHIVFTLLFLEISCAIATYFYEEHIRIEKSNKNIAHFEDRCIRVFQWLKEQSISDKQEIEAYKNRLTAHINKSENAREIKKQRLEKWVQILLIPVSLAAFSALMKEQTDISIIIWYTFIFVVLAAVICAYIWGISSIIQVLTKRKLAQIQMFINDLQGILDTQFKYNKDDSQ